MSGFDPAKVEALAAQIKAMGFATPDHGLVMQWRDGGANPVWVSAEQLVSAVLGYLYAEGTVAP